MIECPLCQTGMDVRTMICPNCGIRAERKRSEANRTRATTAERGLSDEPETFVTPMPTMPFHVIEKFGELVIAGEDDRAAMLYAKQTGESVEDGHAFIGVYREIYLQKSSAPHAETLRTIIVAAVILALLIAAGYGLRRIGGF